jgi:hypothetical protein
MKTLKPQSWKRVSYLFLLLFFLPTLALRAQSNFRPGFIITMQQDTIYGEIDLRTNRLNAERCTFRANGSSEIQVFTPFDILAYRFSVEGKFYVSKQIELTPGVPVSVFLEYLLEGMRSLYYYETDKSIPIYFVQVGERLVKVDAPYLTDNGTGQILVHGKDKYIPILGVVFDAPEVKKDISKASYTRKSMIKIARDYHYATCTTGEDCVEFETAEHGASPLTWSLTPYAGVVQHFMPKKETGEANPDLGYLFGVTFTLTNPRWSKALSFVADFSVAQYAGKFADDVYFFGEDGKYVSTNKYSGHILSGKLGVRFGMPNGVVRPFIGAGIDLSGVLGDRLAGVFGDDGDPMYAGYYIDAGLNIKLSDHRKDMIMVRGRFNTMTRAFFTGAVNRGLDVTVGYSF